MEVIPQSPTTTDPGEPQDTPGASPLDPVQGHVDTHTVEPDGTHTPPEQIMEQAWPHGRVVEVEVVVDEVEVDVDEVVVGTWQGMWRTSQAPVPLVWGYVHGHEYGHEEDTKDQYELVAVHRHVQDPFTHGSPVVDVVEDVDV